MKLFGLTFAGTRAAFYWHLGLGLLCAALAYGLLRLDPGYMLAGALSAVVFFVSEVLHQLGHAAVARLVGHPMAGVHFFSLFGASIYPADEPPLPRRVHVLRALGGFWVNVVIGLALLPLALRAWPQGGVGAWVLAFAVVANLLVLGLGAFLPITVPGGTGGTDGAALLRYWQEAQRENVSG